MGERRAACGARASESGAMSRPSSEGVNIGPPAGREVGQQPAQHSVVLEDAAKPCRKAPMAADISTMNISRPAARSGARRARRSAERSRIQAACPKRRASCGPSSDRRRSERQEKVVVEVVHFKRGELDAFFFNGIGLSLDLICMTHQTIAATITTCRPAASGRPARPGEAGRRVSAGSAAGIRRRSGRRRAGIPPRPAGSRGVEVARKIWWSIRPTVCIDSARNSSQPKQTIWNVSSMPRGGATTASAPQHLASPGTAASQSLCRASAAPCSAPQRMKRTAAPCHSPPSSMVSSRFP